MKLFIRCASAVLAVLLFDTACSPPRPRENAAQPLGSVAPSANGHDGAQGGSAGSLQGRPDDVPDDLPGFGGSGSVELCGAGPSPDLTFSKKNLLASAAQCAELRFCEFEHSAAALAERARSFGGEPSEGLREELQLAFRRSMFLWARAEAFQFGPTASAMKDPAAGKGMRDLIYSWPQVSRCRVEEQLFGKAYKTYGFDNLIQVPINSRGLFAIEYLAFYEGQDNACGLFTITNVGDAWANTSTSELSEMKHEYLVAVAEDVALRAKLLTEEWSPLVGDFRSQFTSASGYTDQQQALNLLAHALLYAEVEIKDYKLGAPAGLYENAPLERPEASFAWGSTQLIAQNLAGFRDIFAGCGGEGLGFDDWLVAAGHEDLAQDILAALGAAEEAVSEFPDLAQASVPQLIELHAIIKVLTDLLKTDLFGPGSPLGLTLPTSVEGDTD